ncbi:MAG: hypothetical protein WD768_02840 [Phycisphaeraceae bacterium]
MGEHMGEVNIDVDGLTQSIIEVATAISRATVIRWWDQLDSRERARVLAWQFNWSNESELPGRIVAGLTIRRRKAIEGLISMEDVSDHLFIHLIESAPHNIGRKKRYRGVPANLFAFACQQAMALGFAGEVAFLAKAELVEHYKTSLGAVRIGASTRMIIPEQAARMLIDTYSMTDDTWPI